MGLFEIRRNGDAFRWTLKANNNEVVLASESYPTKDAAKNGALSVQINGEHQYNYEKRTSRAQQPFFVLKSGNGEIVGTSEMYSSVSARDRGIMAVMSAVQDSRIDDLTHKP